MTRSGRLKDAREKAGFASAAEAARRFGWTATTYYGHENGSRGFGAQTASDYARAFRVLPEWLLFGRGAPVSVLSEAPLAPSPASADLVPVYAVQASAGDGAFVQDHEEIVDRLAFPPGYLRSITRADPRNLAIIGVKGDSMLPTLADNDVVMVDTSKRDLSFDGLFVLRDGGASLLVKRIGRGSARGRVTVISDNRTYPPIDRPVEEIEVVGKVVWRGVRE